jgi:hypothetical protein
MAGVDVIGWALISPNDKWSIFNSNWSVLSGLSLHFNIYALDSAVPRLGEL